MTRRFSVVFSLCLALLSARAAGSLDPVKLDQMDGVIEQAIAEHRLPGAVLWVEHGGDI